MLGIYLHVPFCVARCRYCDFLSFAGQSDADHQAYFKVLEREIEDFAVKEGRCDVDTVYFGGGTPGYVKSQYITRIMAQIRQCFNVMDTAEITIEVNPESVTEEKMQAYAESGLNRVSIGLQAAQDRLLKKLGRAHCFDDFIKALHAVEKSGITNISADLMFGLPEQTMDDLKESLTILTGISAIRHLSCYSLKVEEGTVFAKMQEAGTLTLPSEKMERAMQGCVNTMLSDAGFYQYEISNYARPGYESRHNSRYWTMEDYIGFGLGAASYYNGRRFTNTFDRKVYLEQRPVPREEEHLLSQWEQQGDFMFLGLRMNRGVSDRDYKRLFGSSFFEDYRTAIQILTSQQLVDRSGDRLFLTDKGRDFADQVFMEFV